MKAAKPALLKVGARFYQIIKLGKLKVKDNLLYSRLQLLAVIQFFKILGMQAAFREHVPENVIKALVGVMGNARIKRAARASQHMVHLAIFTLKNFKAGFL